MRLARVYTPRFQLIARAGRLARDGCQFLRLTQDFATEAL